MYTYDSKAMRVRVDARRATGDEVYLPWRSNPGSSSRIPKPRRATTLTHKITTPQSYSIHPTPSTPNTAMRVRVDAKRATGDDVYRP